MIPVAIFVRVSKGGQDFTRQVEDLTALCVQQGYTVTHTIAEKVSGAKRNADRQGLQELLQLARGKAIRKVLVTEVSRLGRKTSEVLKVLEELSECGVSVYVQNFSMETLNPDGTRNPIAQLIFTLLAEFARLERETMIERIHSGLDEARRKGKTLGRKEGTTLDSKELLKKHKAVVRQLKQGKSIRDVAAICEVSVSTVQKVKKALAG
jgi:DNA invertase Pin-like site-specific DNA recombinase